MQHYLVRVTIFCGAYEKGNRYLVKAPSEPLAEAYAMYCESHNPTQLNWLGHSGVTEPDDEFAYRANATIVHKNHVSVLSEYLIPYTCNEEDLVESGDFKEWYKEYA